MTKHMRNAGLALLAVMFWGTGVAMAAKPGLVRDNTGLLDAPNSSAQVVENVASGTQVQASNLPTNGYHKVRLPDGRIGWIAEGDIDFQTIVPGDTEDMYLEEQRHREMSRLRKTSRHYGNGFAGARFRFLTGGQFYSASALNVTYGQDVFKNANMHGVEIDIRINPTFALVARGELLYRNSFASATLTSTLTEYDLTLRSWPVMGGFEFTVIDEYEVSLQLGALVGAAFGTKVTSKARGLDAPNETELTDTAFTAMGKVDFGIKLNRSFEIFLEGGYRYLKAGTPTLGNSTANGAGIYTINATTGASTTGIDLSGVFIAGGLAIYVR